MLCILTGFEISLQAILVNICLKMSFINTVYQCICNQLLSPKQTDREVNCKSNRDRDRTRAADVWWKTHRQTSWPNQSMASSRLTARSQRDIFHWSGTANNKLCELKRALIFQLGSLINNRGRLLWSWGWLRHPLVWHVIISPAGLKTSLLCVSLSAVLTWAHILHNCADASVGERHLCCKFLNKIQPSKCLQNIE